MNNYHLLELEYKNILLRNFTEIDQFKNYKLVSDEKLVEGGRVDIFARQGRRGCLIELKKNSIDPTYQLLRYSKRYKDPILIGITESSLPVHISSRVMYLTFSDLTIEGSKINYLTEKVYEEPSNDITKHSLAEIPTADTLDKLKVNGLMLTIIDASQYMRCSRNDFKKIYVDTKLIEPLYLKGQKLPKFSLIDLIKIPEKIKQRQEASRNSKGSASYQDLAFETAMRETQ